MHKIQWLLCLIFCQVLIVRSFSKLVVLPLEGPDILQTIFFIYIYLNNSVLSVLFGIFMFVFFNSSLSLTIKTGLWS